MSEKNNNSFESTVSSLLKEWINLSPARLQQEMQSLQVIPSFFHWWMYPLAQAQAQAPQRRRTMVPVVLEEEYPECSAGHQDDNIRLVNVKNQDAVTKILDMVPDFVNKFTAGKKSDPEVDKAVDEIVNPK